MAFTTAFDSKRHTNSYIHTALKKEPVIFVVEDDSRIRSFIRTLLTYATTANVIEAEDADTALSLANRIDAPVDLLISDVDLHSQRTGIDVAREITASNPDTRVLIISGQDLPDADIPYAWRFMAKPFGISAFLTCVNSLCRCIPEHDNRLKGPFAA